MFYKTFFFLSLLSSCLVAQTTVSGSVSGHWDSIGSPYELTANTFVGWGDTLFIDSAVVDLGSDFEFRVQGILFASGSLFDNGDRVRGDNGYLEFANCSFTRLQGGVYINSGRAQIDECRIEAAEGTGLTFSNTDSSYVRNSQILNNGDYGIKILQSDAVEVSGNTLSGNSANDFNHPALFIDSCSPQVIENNMIVNNHGQGIGIWTLTAVAGPVIRHNLIRRNFTGITLVSAPALIVDNIIVANYQEGNFNSGAGIYAGYASSFGIIMGNYIGGNFYGVSIVDGAAPNLGDMINDYPGDDGLNLFYDNTFEGQTWHIWNGTSAQILAQNNYWLGLELSEVDATLYDNEEGSGEILFEPIYAPALPEPPDINDDGSVNVLDVVVLIENGFGIPDPVDFYLSDINHDFDINVSDIIALVEIVVQ